MHLLIYSYPIPGFIQNYANKTPNPRCIGNGTLSPPSYTPLITGTNHVGAVTAKKPITQRYPTILLTIPVRVPFPTTVDQI